LKNSKSNTDDFDLFLLKKGDQKIYKAIFDTYFKRLYSFSIKYVKSTHAAEEIVENVFLILWQKRHKLDTVKNLKSYLYAMVHNASLDYIKSNKNFIQFNIKEHDSTILMEQLIIEEEVHILLIKALDSLPEKCRQVFELSCLEGMKYKDIAEDLQISVNTVKSQRARAIDLLRQKLKDYPFFQLFLSFL